MDSNTSRNSLIHQSWGRHEQSDVEGEPLLPVAAPGPRHGPLSEALIQSELLDSDTTHNDATPPGRRIYLEACRRSLDFQLQQYLSHLGRVRAAGMDPKDLLNGLGEINLLDLEIQG
jgi:hypothetical protein